MRTKKSRTRKQQTPDIAAMRSRILDAAFKTFLTSGYDRASTLDIATEARVSKRELYAYFKNKEALFAAGIKARTAKMRVPLASPDVSSPAALARTLEAFGVSLLTGVTHPNVLGVHRLVIAESVRAPELATILNREGRDANVHALAELIRTAQEKGFLVAGGPSHLAGIFISLLWGDLLTLLLLGARKAPSPAEIESRACEATRAFLERHAN